MIKIGLSPDLKSMEQIRSIIRPTDVPGKIFEMVVILVIFKNNLK